VARPPKILDEDLVNGILAMIELGVYPTHAAQANGISESTLANWLARGEEWAEADPADYPEEEAENIAAYVAFLGRAIRAEARGLAWHEINVRAASANNRDRDGRLSLEFLARRRPAVYSRRDRLDVSHGGREPAPVDRGTFEEVAASFDAVGLPEGITPDLLLPAPEGE